MKKRLLVFAGLLALVSSLAYAETKQVADIVLGGAEQASPLNWDSDKPVWKTGTIDILKEDGMVIDDSSYRWSRFGVSYRGPNNEVLDAGDFKVGDRVTFVLEDGRKTISTLIKGDVEKKIKSNP